MSKHKGDLPREEWNFLEKLKGANTFEVHACWDWEFYRELYRRNIGVREAVAFWRDGAPKQTPQGINYPKELITPDIWCEKLPQWPESPYWSLSSEIREKTIPLVRDVEPDESQLYSERDLQVSLDAITTNPAQFGSWEPDRSEIHRFDGMDIKGYSEQMIPDIIDQERFSRGVVTSSVAAFNIEWELTDSQIKAAFMRWLSAARVRLKVSKSARQTQPKAILIADMKALVALRLESHCGSSIKALEEAQKLLGEGAYSNDESGFSVALTRARKVLEGFRLSFAATQILIGPVHRRLGLIAEQ